MFATMTALLAHTITSFQCSLCKVIIYAKKHKRVLRQKIVYSLVAQMECMFREENLVTVSPCGFPLNCFGTNGLVKLKTKGAAHHEPSLGS